MALSTTWTFPMTPQDKDFYIHLGQRIAALRKDNGMTQQKLASALGISQQTLAHYEVGRLRIAVAMLSHLADILSVSVEVLIAEDNNIAKKKRGPTSVLQQQIEQISLMPRAKQKFISEMLGALIQQQKTA